MIQVYVKTGDVPTIISMVHDLKDSGYTIGIDFDFEYKPENFDSFSGDVLYNKHTLFRFYTEESASWFSLKWAQFV